MRTQKGNKLAKIAATSLALAGSAQAQELQSTFSTRLTTEYLGSLGFSVSRNPAIQTSYGFTVPTRVSFVPNADLSVWNSYDIKEKEMTEIDLAVSFPLGIPGTTNHLDTRITGTYLTLPNPDIADSQELGIKTTAKNIPLRPSLNVAQTFGEASSGQHAEISLDKEIALDRRTSLRLHGVIGYNREYFTENSGFSHGAVQAGISRNLGKGWSIGASVRGQTKLEDKFDGTFQNRVQGAISISKSWGGK